MNLNREEDLQIRPHPDSGEIIHHGPLATLQNWDSYTAEDHAVWALLYEQQMSNLQDIAYSPWLEAIHALGLHQQQIPKLSEIAPLMYNLTRWMPVPISGFLTPKEYFGYVAKRQFPTVVRIRSRESWEFQVEPDLFHDAFGHLPMHADSVLADFLHLYGEIAFHGNEQQVTELTRLYWFTIEYGLIHEKSKVKVCGSGHMSGYKEARYSLSNEVEKRPFKLDDVIQQDYNPHILQKVLFVLDSYEQLYAALKEYQQRQTA
jgi:phenylalanine-4-hydroxylase